MPPTRPLRCPVKHESADFDAALLLKVLGPRKFLALQKLFGGKRLWIPKAGSRLRCQTCKHRNHCIRVWRSQGHDVRAISRHLGLSPKTVYRILG